MCLTAMAVLAILAVAVPSAVVAQQNSFVDVESGSHKRGIDALNELGLFEGTECGEGMFCPSRAIKRSTMAVWLVRALEDGEPTAVSATRFADVDADEWWMPYVERLAELGVTVGCRTEPLRYCPDKSATRAQMATLLFRAFDLEAAPSAGFADTEDTTHETSIDALAAARITVGCRTEPLRYCPSNPVTRAQMATFLARALHLIPLQGDPDPTNCRPQDAGARFGVPHSDSPFCWHISGSCPLRGFCRRAS